MDATFQPIALVIDQNALHILGDAITETEWFYNFRLPLNDSRIRRVVIDNIVYLLSAYADDESGFLVIDVQATLLSKSKYMQLYGFNRIVHAALSVFEETVAVPVQWKKYSHGAKLSIYANPRSSKRKDRIYLHRNPGGRNAVYAYAVTDETYDFNKVDEDIRVFEYAYTNIIDALLSDADISDDNDQIGIVLTEAITPYLISDVGLKEWIDKRLTSEQKRFVDKPFGVPVRLRGAAGTGKTLALGVRFLKDAYEYEDTKAKKRLAFITHSWATVRHVQNLLISLDEKRLWGRWEHVHIRLASLYDLANEILRYDFEGLEPLHKDGVEGRKMQMELIDSVIKEFCSNSKHKLHDLRRCSPFLADSLLCVDNNRRRFLIRDIMNEFASVLDAEKIRLGTKAAEKYIVGKRESWQMELPLREDREIILCLHDQYCEQLKQCGALSLDQMISDLNRHLESYAWERIKGNEGFDAIYVDELHLFTRPERMALHSLFRNRDNGMLSLFMSYDLRQSPDDTFIGIESRDTASSFFRSIGANTTEAVELTRVFRYTAEITEFLVQLDNSYPAIDLPGEWNQYIERSQITDGEKPELWIFKKNQDLIKYVFSHAGRNARARGGRAVAVLCISDDLFDTYVRSGYFKDERVNLMSREQVPELRYAGKRFIFSQPRFVAGLQFESVYLINVDRGELLEGEATVGQRRRFISQIYLGASRAEKRLILAASEERGGGSDVLISARDTGALRHVVI